eukprot:970160_1
MAEQQYHYKMKNTNNRVTFDFGISNDSDGYTGFVLRIKALSSSSTVSGMFSIAVDELKRMKNGTPFTNLAEGQRKCVFFFESKLLNNLKSLTLRVSVLFN